MSSLTGEDLFTAGNYFILGYKYARLELFTREKVLGVLVEGGFLLRGGGVLIKGGFFFKRGYLFRRVHFTVTTFEKVVFETASKLI